MIKPSYMQSPQKMNEMLDRAYFGAKIAVVYISLLAILYFVQLIK
jgi:hypothetical protein